MIYKLNILTANIEQETYGGDHGNSIGRGSEKGGAASKGSGVFYGHPRIKMHQMWRINGERPLYGSPE